MYDQVRHSNECVSHHDLITPPTPPTRTTTAVTVVVVVVVVVVVLPCTSAVL
jgi:hypothetical protein